MLDNLKRLSLDSFKALSAGEIKDLADAGSVLIVSEDGPPGVPLAVLVPITVFNHGQTLLRKAREHVKALAEIFAGKVDVKR